MNYKPQLISAVFMDPVHFKLMIINTYTADDMSFL